MPTIVWCESVCLDRVLRGFFSATHCCCNACVFYAVASPTRCEPRKTESTRIALQPTCTDRHTKSHGTDDASGISLGNSFSSCTRRFFFTSSATDQSHKKTRFAMFLVKLAVCITVTGLRCLLHGRKHQIDNAVG